MRFFGLLSCVERRQVDFDWLRRYSLQGYLVEESFVGPHVDSFRSEMTGGKVLATWRKVNRKRHVSELDPVDERASDNIPHTDAFIHRAAYKPFTVVGETQVCDLVAGSVREVTDFVQSSLNVQNADAQLRARECNQIVIAVIV